MSNKPKITSTDDEVVAYLTKLWTSLNLVVPSSQITTQITTQQTISEISESLSKLATEEKNLEEFKNSVSTNLNEIKNIGFKVYGNKKLEKEVNLHPNTITENEITQVYQIKTENNIIPRKQLFKNISYCSIFPKYKSGDGTKPEHFRYLVNHSNPIKINDRLWSVEVVTLCGNNLPDKNIYKVNLVKNWNKSIVEVAIENTLETKGVVLLDITRAFDSIEWSIIKILLTNNLVKKIGEIKGKQLVERYLEVLSNRELHYKSHFIPCSKGIPTGLPSSNIVFTFILEEIINIWISENNIIVGEKFKLNIYVDDIYIKFYDDVNKESRIQIITSLIQTLAKYNLFVNNEKSKADKNLELQSIISNDLTNTDLYLGIPFTRDINLYGQVINNELKKRYEWTWNDVIENIKPFDDLSSVSSSEEDNENKPIINKKILGFLKYKLSPFIEKIEGIPFGEIIINFVKTNFV